MTTTLLQPGQSYEVPFHCRSGAFVRSSTRHRRALISTDPLTLIYGEEPTELDTDWLANWLYGEINPAATPYVGISRLLPGQRLTVHSHATVVEDLIDYRTMPEPTLSGIEAVSTFRSTFDEVVAELLNGNSQVASTLSGGLDSSFMVSSLDLHLGGTGQLELFTHLPHPQMPTENRPGWLASDESAVRSMLAALRTPYHWHPVSNDPRRIPLLVARNAAQRSCWPVFAVDNIPWIEDIHARTHDLGLNQIWLGTHGNAAFSYTHPYARPATTTPLPRKIASHAKHALRTSLGRNTTWQTKPAYTPQSSRETYLQWLFNRTSSHQALRNTAFSPVQVLDPFSHEKMLRLAATITPQTWREFSTNRGFAREVMRGRVPDDIRLRTERGMQSADNWALVTHHRNLYFAELELAADTPIITECVNFDVLRTEMQKWPWGQPQLNREPILHITNRILCFAMFIRDTTSHLHEHNRQLGNHPKTS